MSDRPSGVDELEWEFLQTLERRRVQLSITADTYTHVLSDGREIDSENLVSPAV